MGGTGDPAAGARVPAGRSWPPSCSPRAARRPGRTAARSTSPAQLRRRLAHAQHACGGAGDHGVGRDVLRHDRVGADDAVVADRDAAQDARAVADPAVVPDADVALVDPLEPDRALHLDDAVVEVDQHHAVGDDALAPDRDALEGGDRALLAEHRLRPDRRLALVHAQLRAVADPAPAAEPRAWRRGRSRTSRPGRRSRARRSPAGRASAASARPSAAPAARTPASASRCAARSARTPRGRRAGASAHRARPRPRVDL